MASIASQRIHANGNHRADVSPSLLRLSDVEPVAVQWLWQSRIPRGKLTLLAGDPGRGKSTLSIDFAARVTTGSPWPDGSPCPLGNVVLVSAEDDPGDTIRPRLDLHGADASRVFLLEAVRVAGRERSVTLADVGPIEQAITRVGDVRLLVIDPVSAFGGKANGDKNDEVRGLLAPLAKLAADYSLAVLLVSHLNKGGSSRAMYRAMGSIAWTAAARAAYVVADDPKQPRRLMLPTKNNLGDDRTGFAFRIVDGRIVWERTPVTTSADEALDTERRPGPQPERMQAARRFLMERLRDGPVEAKTIEADAVAAAISPRTLRRASDELDVKKLRDKASKRFVWALAPSTLASMDDMNNMADLDNMDNKEEAYEE